CSRTCSIRALRRAAGGSKRRAPPAHAVSPSSACTRDAGCYYAPARGLVGGVSGGVAMIRRWALSRPGFVGASMAALTVGAGLPAWFAREVVSEAEDRTSKERQSVAPNDRIQLAAIGTGGQGSRVMTEAVLKRPGVELVAACDVDANRRRAAIAKSKL